MQHHDTNLVISKYVQPDLILPEHQKYDIERGLLSRYRVLHGLMNDARVCYSRRSIHNAPSSVQCVCMCVYNIINLNTCEGSGDECVCVCVCVHLLSVPPFCIWKESGDKPSVESSRMLGVRHCYCRTWM